MHLLLGHEALLEKVQKISFAFRKPCFSKNLTPEESEKSPSSGSDNTESKDLLQSYEWMKEKYAYCVYAHESYTNSKEEIYLNNCKIYSWLIMRQNN